MGSLNPLKKGLLLYGDARRGPAQPEELLKYAERYMEEGGLADALNFYDAAGSDDGIRKIISAAVSSGDFFLYRRGCALLGSGMDRGELTNLAQNAKASGKLVFARDAYREAGDDKSAGEVEKLMEG
ncbi:MAG: hypothetical protein JW984_07735 [Deltaproteobacteria bacterium]|uniref:Uncharacterized protein n=1 Tax=Candidatus Zymogenus saltonus TaxID=2844893 RepID=A0A9D8KE65_9DELT|nr:hypothetical protein [Candidatus Zymogenus saltonus]